MYIYILIYPYLYIPSILISPVTGDHWSHPSKLLRLQDFDVGSDSPR